MNTMTSQGFLIKFIFNILIVLMPLIIVKNAIGQKGLTDVKSAVSVISAEDIFKRGTWNFNLNQVATIQAGTYREDGEKVGKNFSYRGRIEVNNFVVDHFGVGAGIQLSGNKTTNTTLDPETVEKINVLGGHVNLLYGTRVGGVVNLLTKITTGYGSRVNTYSGSGGDNKNKENYFFVDGTVGVPLEINRNVYFTPYLGYGYKRIAGGNYTENRSGLLAGFNMDFFMGCGDKICDFGENEFSLEERYNQGDILLGSRFKGMLRTGTIRQKQEGMGGEEIKYRDGFNKSHLGGYGLIYVIDHLGVGAGVDFSHDRTSSKDNDYTTRQTDFLFYPIVRYNAPFRSHMKDLYIQASYGVGFSGSKTENAGNTIKENAFVSAWDACLGYNYFIAAHFSIGPMIGFQGLTANYKEDDYKESYSGFTAAIAWNYHIY